ncbi:MAG TPA: LecA/PA-IL family lectin [Pyrinomonadaceae bacterium]
MKKILLALIIIIAAVSLAAADTIYLRDGRTIRGTLLGFVNGRFVVRVEQRYATVNPDSSSARMRTSEGDIQYFRPEEVDRIEIEGRTIDEARTESRSVQVTLDSNWTDSGIYLRRGERVQVSATGVITVGRSRISPDGLRSNDPTAPLPNASEGELIGAIGRDPSAPIVELGSNREFTADRNGRLFLTANRGSFADARGAFTVQIRRQRDLNTRDAEEDRGDTGIRSRGQDNSDRNRDRGRSPREITINVPATSRGTDAGIDVRSGDQITISATGTITAGRRVGDVGPDGARSTGIGINVRPLPTAGVGALIAYIRMPNGQLSQAYLIGSNLTTTVPTDGRLILAINDDDYSDNSGSFSVRIRY